MSESETQEVQEENSREFFESVSRFFTKDPTSAIWFLHVTTTDLSEAIGKNEELSKEVNFYMGRIDVLEDLLWESDRNKVITEALAKSEVLADFLKVLALIAKTYSMVKDNDIVAPQIISENMEEISRRLSELLRTILDSAEEKAYENKPS